MPIFFPAEVSFSLALSQNPQPQGLTDLADYLGSGGMSFTITNLDPQYSLVVTMPSPDVANFSYSSYSGVDVALLSFPNLNGGTTSLQVDIFPVPEPSTLVLVAMATPACVYLVRRSRRRGDLA